MPHNMLQWIWFAFFVIGSTGGWLMLAVLVLGFRRARQVERVVIE